ncbi:hypothetical protein BS47DRAFT_1338360 [Hydnum rufescens UP504]|uniref:Uncharacterized protein n=1 Tax=Hydnum rufescens UP504 TaxID=1448309 RepID=A0A9P6B699_9AGAM|nr:hypothetical protein BS47DRAFT_1338360 [Hydnum rufescens UP504]
MNKTHERNRRRRELRRARRSQSEGHAANILPSGREANTNNSLGQPSPGPPDDESLGPAAQPLSATATPLHPSAITPSYKKGFRQAMEKTQPMRIVFGDKNGDVANEAASVVMGDTSTAIDEPRPLPTLVPPSQRSDLPPNLFVTSVNVEADLWGGVHAIGSENVEIHGDTNGEMAVFSPSSVDWDALDSSWPGLPVVSRFLNGMIVAWQELGIDPATLSPKMMMSLGRVISHDDTSQTRVMIGFGYGVGLPSDDSLALSETKGWRVFWTPA